MAAFWKTGSAILGALALAGCVVPTDDGYYRGGDRGLYGGGGYGGDYGRYPRRESAISVKGQREVCVREYESRTGLPRSRFTVRDADIGDRGETSLFLLSQNNGRRAAICEVDRYGDVLSFRRPR